MSDKLEKINWVCSSHWDREWYRPFEGFRCRLVDMLDRAIDCVEKVPGYTSFLLDGQSIILRDYLDARPDMLETVNRLLEEEKLFAGPFFVLQDEMVEDGELFVRNLQKGVALARKHGTKRFVAYSTDSFGHCAQMPQFLRLSGVDSIVMSRAFTGEQQDNLWRAPDGSEVLFVWLQIGNGGGAHTDCLDDARHIPEDPAEALAQFERYLERLKPRTRNKVLLIMDGGDHLSADPAGLLLGENFNASHPEGPRFGFSSLPDTVDEMRSSGAPAIIEGEIRMSGKTVDSWLLPGTYSTRMLLKHGMSVLTRKLLALEKLSLLQPYSLRVQSALEQAWDLLLQNIPHDSICGCHVDEVYVDNLGRLNSARSIIDYLSEKLLRAFHPPQATTPSKGAGLFYDPAPNPASFKPFVLDCCYPCIEDPQCIALAADGVDFAISRVERYPTQHGHLATYRIQGFCKNSSGLNVFGVELQNGRADRSFAQAEVEPPLLTFLDSGDVGDTYNYSPPDRDEVICSTGKIIHEATAVLHENLVQKEVETLLSVPSGATSDRQARSAEQCDLRVKYTITKDRISGLTFLSGFVDNMAADHRLRLVIPVAVSETHSVAGAPFHLERRPCAIEFDPAQCSERPLTDYPFVDYIRYGGTSVYAESNGEFQITSRGIEVTLCRSVGWLGRPDLSYRKGQAGPKMETPMAQMLNTRVPFGFVIAATLPDLKADYLRKELLSPVQTQCVWAEAIPSARLALPVSVQGAEITAMRWVKPGVAEIRIFNPDDKVSVAHLRFATPAKRLVECDLNGEAAPDDFAEGEVTELKLSLRPFQVLTLFADF